MTNVPVPSFMPTDGFARAVLSAAAEVEAADTAIKSELLRAARAGDCGAVIDIVTRWQGNPATEVLKPPGTARKPLDPCGEMSVVMAPSRPTSAREV
ncbi:MAG: hypothetical protein ACKVZJ_06210 [Phycisphaerales bacterium]